MGQFFVEVTSATGLSCNADASLVRISTAADLRRPRAVERSRLFPWRSRADRLADAALDTPLPESNPGMHDMILHDALQILSDVTGLRIRVDWQALNSVGLRWGTPIDEAAKHVTPRQMLRMILRDTDVTDSAQFTIRDGEVVISTRNSFDSQEPRARIATVVAAAALLLAVMLRRKLRRRAVRPLRQRFRAWAKASATAAVVLIGALLVIGALLHLGPVEFCALSRRFTVNDRQGLLRLWVTPADPLEPYWKRRADYALVGSPAVDTIGSQVVSTAGVHIVQRRWPFNTILIESPFLLVIAMTAALPAISLALALIRFAKHQRNSELCECCGYDLRASADRCPECGTPFLPKMSGAPGAVSQSLRNHQPQ